MASPTCTLFYVGIEVVILQQVIPIEGSRLTLLVMVGVTSCIFLLIQNDSITLYDYLYITRMVVT